MKVLIEYQNDLSYNSSVRSELRVWTVAITFVGKNAYELSSKFNELLPESIEAMGCPFESEEDLFGDTYFVSAYDMTKSDFMEMIRSTVSQFKIYLKQ